MSIKPQIHPTLTAPRNTLLDIKNFGQSHERMKTFASICLLIVGFFALPAHAQVYPCSGPGPGEVVVGQTDAGNGVAPMLLCQRVQTSQAPQTPQPQWQSRWGAIATDADKAAVGSATGLMTQDEAERSAVTDCLAKGGKDCKLQVSYANGCGAMVLGDKAFTVNFGNTEAEAIEKATSICSTSSSNCHAYFTTCSPAVRVH